ALVGIAGLAVAHFLYLQHRKTGELLTEEAKRSNFIYQFLYNKWWWDALYNKIFIDIGGKLADRVFWRIIDVGIIDGIVNGLAGFVGLFARITRRLQTGYVRNYALAMLLGVVLLISALLIQWSKKPEIPVRKPPSAGGLMNS